MSQRGRGGARAVRGEDEVGGVGRPRGAAVARAGQADARGERRALEGVVEGVVPVADAMHLEGADLAVLPAGGGSIHRLVTRARPGEAIRRGGVADGGRLVDLAAAVPHAIEAGG